MSILSFFLLEIITVLKMACCWINLHIFVQKTYIFQYLSINFPHLYLKNFFSKFFYRKTSSQNVKKQSKRSLTTKHRILDIYKPSPLKIQTMINYSNKVINFLPQSMSKSSAKKINSANKTVIRDTIKYEILSILFLGFFLIFRPFSRLIVPYMIIEIGLICYLKKISSPTIVDGQKVPGVDLYSRGVIALLFDMVYMCWVGKILVLFTKFIILLELIMLFLCIYFEFKSNFVRSSRN